MLTMETFVTQKVMIPIGRPGMIRKASYWHVASGYIGHPYDTPHRSALQKYLGRSSGHAV